MYRLNRRYIKLIKFSLNYCKSSENGEKSNAIQYNPTEKTLEIIRKLIPQMGEIPAEEALIKMAYAGISGIDLKIINGEYPLPKCGNVTPGHEICGIVCKNSGDFKTGDRVTVNPTRGCQVCEHCRDRNEHHCTEIAERHIGINRDGGWQEYCTVPVGQLHRIPSGVSLEDAITAYPLSCIWHTWRLLKPVTHAPKILLIGAGFIGNLFAAFFHLNGHKNVIICEENIKKLNTTVQLSTCYDLITPDVLQQRVIKSKSANLFDVIVDCSGCSKMIEMAVDLLNYGGKFCIFGTTNWEAEIKISPYEIFRKELEIFAPKFNPYSFPDAFSIIKTMNSRYVSFDKLGVKLFKLCDYREALSCLRQGTVTKAVFCFVEPENTEM